MVGSNDDVKIIHEELNTLATIQNRQVFTEKEFDSHQSEHENRYEINKLISPTRYIIKRLKEPNDIVLGVLTLRDLFVVYAQCQAAKADTRNTVIQLTAYIKKKLL